MAYSNAIRAAALRAADWLETNPDKHIPFVMAGDEDHNPVSLADATCFCAVGRFLYEYDPDLPAGSYTFVADRLLGMPTRSYITHRNDDGFDFSGYPKDQSLGIKALRSIAA